MKILTMFYDSASELKSIRCLTTTGVLVATGIVLNMPGLPFSFQVEMFKITFGYLAIATIAMLYGPVVAMIAAIPYDLIPAAMGAQGVNFFFLIPEVLIGLIFGIFLYGYASRGIIKGGAGWAAWQVMRIAFARLLVMVVCYFLLNNFIIFLVMLPPGRAEQILSEGTFWAWAFARNGVKNIVQFPIDMVLMFTLLPIINNAYRKAIRYNN